MEGIRLFMWGFQQHFQSSVQHQAERLFKAVDPEFEVKIFLLGIDRTQKPDNWPVCLEPEECGFDEKEFSSVHADTQHFLENDPERNVLTMEPSHSEAIQRRVLARAQRKAVFKVLNSKNSPSGSEFFFSGFMPVADYNVGVVMNVTQKHGVEHYRLPQVHAYRNFNVPASLIEAVARQFLMDCNSSLHVPQPEKVADLESASVDEILARAGVRLMEAPVYAGSGLEIHGLFKACEFISSLTYEKSVPTGEMIIARKGHSNVKATVTLEKPIDIDSYRAIRKLLEISSAGDAILTDGSAVTGFGRLVGQYKETDADLMVVRFLGHQKWELCHGKQILMRVLYGKPTLPLPPLNPFSYTADFERIFRGIPSSATQHLFALSDEACNQRHGTVLIITPEASAEAKRLATQGTRIVPIQLTRDILRSITAIDGAVMLDTNGVCHAIGVILDGEALDFGNPARGARYNSSLRYVAHMEKRRIPCAAIVVSEDGTAEWIPKLLPRVSITELKVKEEEADAILQLSVIPIRRSTELLSWLHDHRFYLPQLLCDKANKIEIKRIAVLQTKVRLIYFEYKQFTPNPNMSNDYLQS
jgi:hypothetical protein